jgi:uncharacterized protein YbjT (DUF2867 family)
VKVLIVGASGFIGQSIYNFLKRGDCFEVVAGLRKLKDFEGEFVEIDFAQLQNDKELVNKLKKFDVIVNAVGIIAESHKATFEQIHTIAPSILFDACKEAGVNKVVQISALGTEEGTTHYHQSKNRADAYLRELGIGYAILHPSVVYGEGGKSTALFQALASLPFIPVVGDGSQKLQPIAIEDFVLTVKRVIQSKESQIELDLVGGESLSYKEMLQGFRERLGFKETKVVSVPTFGSDVMGKVLNEPTISQDNITMLNQGNSASVEPLKKFLNYTPVTMQERLFSTKASNAEKLSASLYFMRPLLRIIIAFVWIWSGIVSAFLYPQELALELLYEIGTPEVIALPLLYIASFLDIIIGLLMLLSYRLQLLLKFQLLVIFVYTLLLTFLATHHWLHPFGPVLKNLPLLVSIYILSRLEKFR